MAQRDREPAEIIGDDSEPHPTLHAALAAVSAAPQTMTALERTDPSFTARSPAEGQAGNSRAGCARLARKHDMPDSALVRDAFRHRLVLSYRALAEEVAPDTILDQVLAKVPLPQIDLGRYNAA